MADLRRKEDPSANTVSTNRMDAQSRISPDVRETESSNRPRLVRNEGLEAANRERLSSATTSQRGQSEGAARTPLFSEADIGILHARWSNVQAAFVDEPRNAVKEADLLVTAVIKRLTDSFATERANLEEQWDRGDAVSTESLRLALQRYRTFFDRLLNV